MQLRRFIDRVRRGGTAERARDQGERIAAVIRAGPAFDDLGELADGVIAAAGGDRELYPETVGALIQHVRGFHGEPGADESHIRFWQRLYERFSSPLLRACCADAELAAGLTEVAVEGFLSAFEAEPDLVVEFDGELEGHVAALGGLPWLRYQLACLRGQLAEWEEGDAEDGVREFYSRLLEEHAGDPDGLARIRQVGHIIDRMVAQGQLPRAMVRRGTSRD